MQYTRQLHHLVWLFAFISMKSRNQFAFGTISILARSDDDSKSCSFMSLVFDCGRFLAAKRKKNFNN
jgi:hypothetical protein